MRIDCEFSGAVRDAVGSKRLSREFPAGTTVREALDALAAEADGVAPLLFDAGGRLRPTVVVSVGGSPVRDEADLASALADGDTLIITPGVAGG